MSNRGRPRKWIDKKDVDYGRALLKCKLIDRIYLDRVIGRKVLQKPCVRLRDAFWICDGLTPQEAGKALRSDSSAIAEMLFNKDIKRSSRSGNRLRDFYYTWYKPGDAILRTVGRRIDKLRLKGTSLNESISIIEKDGLHPKRTTNKEFLPRNVIRNFYYRSKKQNL